MTKQHRVHGNGANGTAPRSPRGQPWGRVASRRRPITTWLEPRDIRFPSFTFLDQLERLRVEMIARAGGWIALNRAPILPKRRRRTTRRRHDPRVLPSYSCLPSIPLSIQLEFSAASRPCNAPKRVSPATVDCLYIFVSLVFLVQ